MAKENQIDLKISKEFSSEHLQMISKEKFEISFLYEIYKTCQEKHPIEENLFDYEVQEFEREENEFLDEEEEGDADFQMIRTPGLETLYEKWASGLISWQKGNR